jgi:alkanesulfonate monooxygenase SsuD/methylene tetrahydromethanopterin reductase-like flavin-dependent oxidoreductase (luciferase family)
VVLGIGVGGEYPPEFRACGIPVRERGPRTDEMIPLIRRLWTAEEVSHEGRFYAMHDVRIMPAPVQPGGPPIVVAGRQEAAMRRAALLGDGWFPYLYSPRRYAASVATVQQAAADAARDLSAFDWYLFLFVNVGADGDAAREQAARSMGATYSQDFRAMVDRVAAAGTVDDVTRRAIEFYDAGARHFVFCPATAGADPRPVEDRLLEDVVPALRAHAAAAR